MDGPEVKNPIALYDMVKEREAEIERVKGLGQQYERDSRKFFDQSCLNLQRAEKAEAEVARLKSFNEDLEYVNETRAASELRLMKKLREAQAHAVAMRAALERVEWCVASSDDGPSCPLCASACPRHAKDCVVGAALVWTGDSPTDPVK